VREVGDHDTQQEPSEFEFDEHDLPNDLTRIYQGVGDHDMNEDNKRITNKIAVGFLIN
jgi:hypothetical protein